MSASLERRYRETLDWYPASWRDANAEAMLGTLLDEAEATGRTTPSTGQTLNLLAFALLERTRSALPGAVRDRVSALAWGLGASISVVMFVAVEWAPWHSVARLPVPWHDSFGPFVSASVVLVGLWVLAFALAVAGAGTVARWLLAATIPTSVALVAFDSQLWAAQRPPATALVLLAVLALLTLQGSPAATGRGRAWILVCAVAAAAVVVPAVFDAPRMSGGRSWWFPRETWTEATRPLPFVAILIVVALVALIARRRVWAAAIAIFAVPFVLNVAAIIAASGGAVYLAGSIVALAILAIAVRLSGYGIVVTRRDRPTPLPRVPPLD